MILKMIKEGQFKDGEKIPSEIELGEKFEASRITVRRAIKELADEGALKIVRGKGTYVNKVKRPLHLLNLEEGFTDGLDIGKNHITKVIIEKKVITASKSLMKIFKRTEPFQVLKLVRKIQDKDSVISVDFAYMPTDIYPNIEDKVQDNISTFRLINHGYGIHFHKAKKEVEIIYPNDEITKLMNVSNLDPIVQIRKLIWDKDKPVHFSQYYLRTDSVKLSIEVDANTNKIESDDIPNIDIFESNVID